MKAAQLWPLSRQQLSEVRGAGGPIDPSTLGDSQWRGLPRLVELERLGPLDHVVAGWRRRGTSCSN